ncbi:MAG: aldo/keto reductase, partial [Flavobacteriales bacterium 32-34-25]
NVGLFAYSPMAFGVLSGKFLTGESHPNARIKLFPQFSRYNSAQSTEATTQYVAIAKKHGLSPAQMALAFVNQQTFVTSNIIGATTLDQLKENIASIDVVLSDEIIKEINAVHAAIPDPAP